MTVGFGTRRSRRPASTLTASTEEARILMAAHAPESAEYRRRGGRLEYRIPGADWRPIEEAANPRPVQLAALTGATEEENR